MNTNQLKHSGSANTVNKKRRQSKKSLLEQQLQMIRPNAAGSDVASAEHWVCVPADRAEQHIRRFETFTCDLYRIFQSKSSSNLLYSSERVYFFIYICGH